MNRPSRQYTPSVSESSKKPAFRPLAKLSDDDQKYVQQRSQAAFDDGGPPE